ncbi:Na+/H+ antiporter subunit G [Halobacteriales archaeon QS_1_68_17]|nr:MAG: Na+/H+ antiporter subunit G [Halobacteriales archaeon QS_1_68_17]
MTTVADAAIVALAVGGVFFGLVAAVGILRLPDLYTRTHAASKSDTLGSVLTLGAVAIALGADLSIMKTVLLLLFLFVTNPTAAHAITRAAHEQGIDPWRVDDEGGGE